MVDPNGGGTMSRSHTTSATPKGASNSGKMPQVRIGPGTYPVPATSGPARPQGRKAREVLRLPHSRPEKGA
jgi:hypothetical protein